MKTETKSKQVAQFVAYENPVCLSGVCIASLPHGVEIIGNGTLKNPLDVKLDGKILAAENATLSAENKRLREALEQLRKLVAAAERIEPQIVRGGLREEQDFKAARLSAAQFLKGGAQ